MTLCRLFVSNRGISECLPRLTCMIRGIGDPLVSVYARAYLCRVSTIPTLPCVTVSPLLEW